VDRRQDLSAIRRLLDSRRLVTLTGVGGVGKTRLALLVAADVARSFPDGVWLVDLSGLQDEALVPQAVCDALGIADQSTRDPVEVLAGYLATRRLLLVLDNCERLVPTIALLVDRLLAAAEGLRILATSRETLQLSGEQVYPVAPLPVDTVDSPGMVLFAARAAAVWPGFAITAENAEAVGRICRQLDGIPLAIELAAARMRALPPQQLAQHLAKQAGLLDLAGRGAVPRHQTMRATLAWSFELCGKPERLLWQRVSVFAGSFDLVAAQEVCAGDGLTDDEVVWALAALVDKSVLIVSRDATPRYRLLDTVRSYGLDRLRHHDPPSACDETALRRRHRAFYVELAERFDADWFGPRQAEWTAQMLAELDNMREALAFCLGEPDGTGTAARLAGSLYYFWYACGGTREGRYWLDRILAADPPPGPALVAALAANARLQLIQGEPREAAETAARCLPLARRYRQPRYVAEALRTIGLGRLYLGDPQAVPVLREAVTRAAALGPSHPVLAFAMFALSVGALFQGDPEEAARLLAEAQAICRAYGDQWWLGITLSAAVSPALRLGQLEQAERYGRESLRVRRAIHDTHGAAASVELLAWTAAARQDCTRAARLLGAADRHWHAVGGSPFGAGPWRQEHERCAAAARHGLGTAFDREYRCGGELNLDEAVAYALDEVVPAASAPEPADARLTRREREIAALIDEGLTNRQIATRLVISQRTVESHVENILTKLGYGSRAQVAAWYARRG